MNFKVSIILLLLAIIPCRINSTVLMNGELERDIEGENPIFPP